MATGIEAFGELDEKGEGGNLALVRACEGEAGDKNGDELTLFPIRRKLLSFSALAGLARSPNILARSLTESDAIFLYDLLGLLSLRVNTNDWLYISITSCFRHAYRCMYTTTTTTTTVIS